MSFEFHDGLDIGQDILPGHFRLEHMGRAAEETTGLSGDPEIPANLRTYIPGGSERHELLCTDGSIEGDPLAELCMDLREVHAWALGLEGIQDIDTQLYEVSD
jgi:hypothetical protein